MIVHESSTVFAAVKRFIGFEAGDLDLDLLRTNPAHGEERLDRLCDASGMSRMLLERVVGGRRQ